MQIVINIDEEIFNKLPEAELGSNIIEDVLEAVENGTILPKEYEQLLYIKGQKDMTNATRKAIDERKENLPKGNMKIGLMIAHNIINNVYRELVKTDKESD